MIKYWHGEMLKNMIQDPPRLRTKEEIIQQADYYVVKAMQTSFMEFSTDEIEKLLEVSGILEQKMNKQKGIKNEKIIK